MTSDLPAELTEARAGVAETRRPTVQAIEEILHIPHNVLDHGFVRVVDYMGDDAAVVQAARVSYGKGTRHTSEDRGLIKYLMRHWHSTPFEMCEIKLHVKLPIFVARQWIRHRTANVNEYSARYSILDNEFYIPDPSNIASQSTANKQGRSNVLPPDQAEAVINLLREDAQRSYDHYTWMLNSERDGAPADPARDGVSRELARIGLGLNTYTQWYWKTDLHNLFRFLKLRADNHAQFEIREYALTILDIVRRWVPLSHEAFLEYQLNSLSLSSAAVAVVRRLVAGDQVAFENSGMTKREWADLCQSIDYTPKASDR